ncbi:PspC domain-containing protein [Balneolaceae bacterium YR4-1]|uniref:PspC domain-containing protein n=1 Tax=Halalkalibaculum roseum TaxID=2709311 RepID=A0A6M1SVQ8_9BACT|nr:PspC domain-containing protein [Halalkalibaculum roseum]NGP76216.1 PspC domain-containing protein [Halalkalibaculum roseum]
MADKTKEKIPHQTLDTMMEFEDHELRTTMQEFLEEEKKANTNIWNFATIAGIAMFFVGMVYLVQSIGLGIGPDLSGIVEVMPLIGGILVTLVGFGFLVGDRKKEKSEKKKKKKQKFDFDFDDDVQEEFNLKNDLDSKFSGKKRSSRGSQSYDSFALRQSKKLYKSRSNKKWAGVCGGLAKYFGISATVVRLLFVITFFAGSGTSLLVYIALAIALDKEPPELMDDFNF